MKCFKEKYRPMGFGTTFIQNKLLLEKTFIIIFCSMKWGIHGRYNFEKQSKWSGGLVPDASSNPVLKTHVLFPPS